jgi:hypothetical protein
LLAFCLDTDGGRHTVKHLFMRPCCLYYVNEKQFDSLGVHLAGVILGGSLGILNVANSTVTIIGFEDILGNHGGPIAMV